MPWNQIGSDIDGEGAGDASGFTISMSSHGSIIAVGAINNDGSGSDSGHVRVFQNINNSWVQIGSDIDGETAHDHSGVVSLSGDGSVVAIGASNNDTTGKEEEITGNAGHVRVFENINNKLTLKYGS